MRVVKRVSYLNRSLRWPPIIKTEASVGPQGSDQRNNVRTIPWDPLQLANLQEK